MGDILGNFALLGTMVALFLYIKTQQVEKGFGARRMMQIFAALIGCVMTEFSVINDQLLILFITGSAILDWERESLPLPWLIVMGVVGIISHILPGVYESIDLLVAVISGGAWIGAGKILRGGLGKGDGIIIGLMGIFLEWEYTMTIVLAAFFLAGLFGMLALLFNKANRKSTMPFIPFLWGGTVILWLI